MATKSKSVKLRRGDSSTTPKTVNVVAGKEVTTQQYRARHNSMKVVVVGELNRLQKETMDARTQRMNRVVREVLRITNSATPGPVHDALKTLGYIN